MTYLRPEVGELDWLDPREYPPPVGVKLFLLTAENIAVIGKWDNESRLTGWRPLFNTPESIKQLQRQVRGY